MAALAQSELPSGSVVAWGRNTAGQTNVPPGLNDVVAVAVGGEFSLALRRNGRVAAWGANDHGQLEVPSDLTNANAIAAGAAHCVALKADGTVVGWPNAAPALTGVVAVACGYYHSLALKSDGTIVGWGDNSGGQCDPPEGVTDFAAIGAGGDHSLGVRRNGTVRIWGRENGYELPQPAEWTQITKLAVCDEHVLALRQDGTLKAWAWAGNMYGQATIPYGLSNVTAMASSYYMSMALQTNGHVVAWGGTDSGGPQIPSQLSNVLAVAESSGHNLALVANRLPALIKQPCSVSAYTGRQVEFPVEMWGAVPIGYQWQFEGSDIPGATNLWLVLPSVQFSDAGNYRLVASNSFGVVTSRVASLTLSERAPFIVRPPMGTSVYLGQDAKFNVIADGSGPFSYQWCAGRSLIPGAANSMFTVRHAQPGDVLGYSVIVASPLGCVTSQVASLIIATPPTNPGSVDLAFNANVNPIEYFYDTFQPPVNSLALDAQGRLYVAGHFRTWEGHAGGRLGAVAGRWQPGPEFSPALGRPMVRPLCGGPTGSTSPGSRRARRQRVPEPAQPGRQLRRFLPQ